MAQKETQLLNSSHSPLQDGRRPLGQSPVVSAGLVLVVTRIWHLCRAHHHSTLL